MNASRALQLTAWLLAGAALLSVPAPPVRAAEGAEDITAVSAQASPDYARPRQANGTFRPETYSFGEGGHWGGVLPDGTIDTLRFIDIARAMAGPLARQNYLPSQDPKRTKFLVMVYWGTTGVPPPQGTSNGLRVYQKAIADYQRLRQEGDPNLANAVLNDGLIQASLENAQRDRLDTENARMLGYDSEGLIGTEYGRMIEKSALKGRRDDLIAEIEDSRYFVVLMAFDFQLLWKEKQHKLLWETRFSIRQRGHDFGRILPAMAQYASAYFGQDSHGLVRKPIPEGQVEVGEPKSLGPTPEK